MPRSKRSSTVWQHFFKTDDANKVMCRICGSTLSIANKSTCSLLRHMKTKHAISRVIKSETSKKSSSDTQNDDVTVDSIPSTSRQTVSVLAVQVAEISQHSILDDGEAEYCKQVAPNKKQWDLDQQLVTMIVKEYHSLHIVEEPEFQKLIHMLNSDYIIPTKQTLSQYLIPTIYNDTREKVKLRVDRAQSICLAIDGWTSENQNYFYSITAHYIVEKNGCAFQTSDLLDCIPDTKKNTAADICELLKNILFEWGIINKITAVVSYNATSIEQAARIAGWQHWECFAQSLNLVVQSGLNEIQEAVGKIKAIVRLFNTNEYACSKLRSIQKEMELPELKLREVVCSRWISTFKMMRSVLLTKDAIIYTLKVLRESLHLPEDFKEVDNDDWTVIDQAENVLYIFDLVINAINAEKYVTLSSLIFYCKQIKKHLNSWNSGGCDTYIKNLIRTLQAELFKRFGDLEESELVGQATILDPRFKKLGFSDEAIYEKTLKKLYSQVAAKETSLDNTEISTSHEAECDQNQSIENPNGFLEDLWNEFDMEVERNTELISTTSGAAIELDKYLSEPNLSRRDEKGNQQDILAWWYQRKNIYPTLYKIMKTRLCIMATSKPCNRIFSHDAEILNGKRERIKPLKVPQLEFLNYNLNNTDK